MGRLTTFFTAAALMLASTQCAVATTGSINNVDGPITVRGKQQTGDLTTVNGAVIIGDGAHVENATTSNGLMILGDKAQARSLRSVSGTITLGVESRVAGDVASLSGRIFLGRGADVAGRLSNGIGPIVLQAAHVAGGITTGNGDIEVGADSRVEGGIVMTKQDGIREGDQGGVAAANPKARGDAMNVGVSPADSVLLTGADHDSAIALTPHAGPATPAQGPGSRHGGVVLVQTHCTDAVAYGYSRGKAPPASAGQAAPQIEVEPGVRARGPIASVDEPTCQAAGPMVCSMTDGRCVRSLVTQRSLPSVVIGPRAVVKGTLDFRAGVILKVSDSATIGPVKGATVQRYSGPSPL